MQHRIAADKESLSLSTGLYNLETLMPITYIAKTSAYYKWAYNSFVLGAMKLKLVPNCSVCLSILNGSKYEAVGGSMEK